MSFLDLLQRGLILVKPFFFVSVWILVGFDGGFILSWELSVFLIINGHTSELIEYLLQAMN